jgi:hypothetical protein
MLQSPISKIAIATDTASRILKLHMELFILKQEMKAIRQLQRVFFLAVSLLFFNLFLTLGFQWIAFGLHEKGWTSFQLALLSWLVFGSLSIAAITLALSQKSSLKPKASSENLPENLPENLTEKSKDPIYASQSQSQ